MLTFSLGSLVYQEEWRALPLKIPLPPPEHRSNLSLEFESQQEEASSGQSNAILVISVNSPIFQSDVISTFDMLVFL